GDPAPPRPGERPRRRRHRAVGRNRARRRRRLHPRRTARPTTRARRRRARRSGQRGRRIDRGAAVRARRPVRIGRRPVKRNVWALYMGAALFASLVYGFLPVTLWKQPIYVGVATASMVAIAVGIVCNRPRRGHPWWLFLAAMVCICAAEWIWFANAL